MKLLSILFLLAAFPVFGQLERSGSLTLLIDSVLTTMPATEFSNEYQEPNTTQLTQWGNIIQSIIQADYTTADSIAQLIDYRVSQFNDTTSSPAKTYYVLAKSSVGANHWGLFIFNQLAQRQKVVIQSPHPLFDTHTGKQGIVIFKTMEARVFCISGTHRCNSADSSACAGTTSVCTGLSNAKFRKSDQPHNITATFQRTTEILNSLISGLVVIQNHGFSKDTGDPDLIMSNGVAKTPSVDYLASVKSNLLLVDSTLTFKILHVDTTWNTLTGTTNVQGRLINGSATPCTKSASTNTGRFLHIEQAYSKLRDTENNRARLANALAASFPSDPLPVELSLFQVYAADCEVVITWATATELNNSGFSVQRRTEFADGTAGSWTDIAFVAGVGNSNAPNDYRFADRNVNKGMYAYRLKQIDYDGSVTYSAVKMVIFNDNLPMSYGLSAYPNPFNAGTRIKVVAPVTGNCRIELYDPIGKKIKQLFEGSLDAGRHEFNLEAGSLASGVYFVRLQGNASVATMKIILQK